MAHEYIFKGLSNTIWYITWSESFLIKKYMKNSFFNPGQICTRINNDPGCQIKRHKSAKLKPIFYDNIGPKQSFEHEKLLDDR